MPFMVVNKAMIAKIDLDLLRKREKVDIIKCLARTCSS